MAETRSCPMCVGGEVVRSEGRLEQSGRTYLPTIVTTCPLCGYAKFEPALGVHWKSDEPVLAVGPGPRRAA